MSAIHSRDTLPEIVVRKWLYANGYRLPGSDIQPVISALVSQRVIKADKSGKITLV